MAKMTVENMVSPNGNMVANQFIIHTEDKITFQSYKSTIAEYDVTTGSLTLGKDWEYSVTTLRYLKSFINDYTKYSYTTKKEFEKQIEEGHITIDESL